MEFIIQKHIGEYPELQCIRWLAAVCRLIEPLGGKRPLVSGKYSTYPYVQYIKPLVLIMHTCMVKLCQHKKMYIVGYRLFKDDPLYCK